MKPEELWDAMQLATRTVVDLISNVEQVHRAAAGRAFALIAPANIPVRVVHDGIATIVYDSIRGACLVAGPAASKLVSITAGSTRPAGSTPRGNLALAVLNATIGNELTEQGSPLAIQMAIRHGREDIAPRRDVLEVAFPEATTKIAIFIHGLGETEESWRLHGDRHVLGTQSTYGTRLAHDFGYTPIYLRYNTGLHISENGRHLTALLEGLVTAWPVPARELILVGHSMGGLVARSACHYAQQKTHSWISRLRHVFYLGTPHLGAGLEQIVRRLSGVLGKLDESQPLAAILNRRSPGIKDLYVGSLTDEEWHRGDCDSKHERNVVPLIPGANHYAISASVTANRRNPLGRLVGDLLVQPASARGRSRRSGHIPFPSDHTRHFGGLHHFNLLNHPAVYEAMSEWLNSGSAGRFEAESAPIPRRSGPVGRKAAPTT